MVFALAGDSTITKFSITLLNFISNSKTYVATHRFAKSHSSIMLTHYLTMV